MGVFLSEESKRQAWESYTADMLCALVRGVLNAKDVPSYSALIKQTDTKQDARTGDEIAQDIAAQLRKRIRIKKGETSDEVV